MEKKYNCRNANCNFMLRLCVNNLNHIIKHIIFCENGGRNQDEYCESPFDCVAARDWYSKKLRNNVKKIHLDFHYLNHFLL